jgi:catechol 2,3-dioxygenase-like lactoylglutathione lyase family enzyme
MGLLLKDVLASGDVRGAVDEIAREFRDKYNLPRVHQLGLVVPDVERAAGELEGMGIGPFFIAGGSPVPWIERGEEGAFHGRLGIAYHQGFELELLEPGEGSDIYRHKLDQEGRIIIHHLGFLVRDVDEWANKLEAQGSPVWVRGRINVVLLKIEFAYMDTVDKAGIIIEFISYRILGLNLAPAPGLIHLLGRLEKWSGKRSLKM